MDWPEASRLEEWQCGEFPVFSFYLPAPTHCGPKAYSNHEKACLLWPKDREGSSNKELMGRPNLCLAAHAPGHPIPTAKLHPATVWSACNRHSNRAPDFSNVHPSVGAQVAISLISSSVRELPVSSRPHFTTRPLVGSVIHLQEGSNEVPGCPRCHTTARYLSNVPVFQAMGTTRARVLSPTPKSTNKNRHIEINLLSLQVVPAETEQEAALAASEKPSGPAQHCKASETWAAIGTKASLCWWGKQWPPLEIGASAYSVERNQQLHLPLLLYHQCKCQYIEKANIIIMKKDRILRPHFDEVQGPPQFENHYTIWYNRCQINLDR